MQALIIKGFGTQYAEVSKLQYAYFAKSIVEQSCKVQKMQSYKWAKLQSDKFTNAKVAMCQTC